MLRLEQNLVREQSSSSTRTLSPVASERVILRLTSFLPDPLAREGADSFSRVLRGDRKGLPDNQLTYRAGSFFLDFQPVSEAETPTATLSYAVERTDTAMIKSMLPAAIVEAWIVPADSPVVSHLRPEDWASLDKVTETAKQISEQFRDRIWDVLPQTV